MTTTIFSLSFFIFLLPALSVFPPAAAEAGKGNWLNALSVLLERVRIFSVRGTDKDVAGDGRAMSQNKRTGNKLPGGMGREA